MGLGQESDREGEVVSWEAASSAPGRVAMNCRKVLFAAIAQNFGRQGLHIMTASMRLVHEGCGSGHITVDGADNDLRKALGIASDGVHRRQSRKRGLPTSCRAALPRRSREGSRGRLQSVQRGGVQKKPRNEDRCRRTLLTPRMTELAFARLRTIVRLGEAVPDIPIASAKRDDARDQVRGQVEQGGHILHSGRGVEHAAASFRNLTP